MSVAKNASGTSLEALIFQLLKPLAQPNQLIIDDLDTRTFRAQPPVDTCWSQLFSCKGVDKACISRKVGQLVF